MLNYRISTLIMILFVSFAAFMCIYAIYSHYRSETFMNSIHDVELSILAKLPPKILARTKVGISLEEQDLNIFRTGNSNEEVQEEVQEEVEENSIAYFADSDLPYINRLSKLYDMKFTPHKISNITDISYHTFTFIRSRINDSLYQSLSSEYELLEFNKERRKYLNFHLPFSKIKTTVDNVSKEIINIIKVPNIVLNPRTIAVNFEASKIFNIHLGKTNFMQPHKKIPKLKKNQAKNVYECVNADDLTTISEYKTKASCESEYDIFGDAKEVKMKWFKRCDDDLECKYYLKNRNSRRGLCKNGLCEEPLMNKFGQPLFYGEDSKDYAFENDLQDRLALNLRPILNL